MTGPEDRMINWGLFIGSLTILGLELYRITLDRGFLGPSLGDIDSLIAAIATTLLAISLHHHLNRH